MVWFKVDDSFGDHTKTVTAGNAAIGLWTRCGAYCAKHLTDGFVPAQIAKLYGQPSQIRALVAAGLWVPEDGGFRMHDFHDYNPTAETVDADRKAAKERQRKAREAARSRRDNAVSHEEVFLPLSRSPRPDPTRPVVSDGDLGDQRASGDARETAHTSPVAELTRHYAAGVPMCDDYGPAAQAVAMALGLDLTADEIRSGLDVLVAEQRSCTVNTLRIAIAQARHPAGKRRSITDKARAWLDAAASLDADDQPPTLRAITGGAS